MLLSFHEFVAVWAQLFPKNIPRNFAQAQREGALCAAAAAMSGVMGKLKVLDAYPKASARCCSSGQQAAGTGILPCMQDTSCACNTAAVARKRR